MALISGTKLGPYQIQALIGAGGMGEVYRARDTRLDRLVAIKILPSSFGSDPERLRRFEQEARAVAALSHPNILAVHDIGSQEGVSYLVSELLEGNTLREQLTDGALPVRKAMGYAVQVAQGLAAAHDKGIVHRDIKPENIFVTKDGRMKILDFGLAQIQTATLDGATAASPTTPGSVLGTVGYMSPEQVRGENLDHRSDIFSFGAVLYEMLSCKKAFEGETSVDVMSAILHEDPPELARATPPVHPAVDRTIRHCLEKNPVERFQSAHDLKFQLEVAFEGLFPATESAAIRMSALRLRWVILLVLAIVAIAVPATFLIARLSAKPALPVHKRLTFRSGSIGTARLLSDGRTIIYGAAWEGNPSDIFLSRVDGSDSRSLAIGPSELLSVSQRGELAVLLKPRFEPWVASGVLATVPLEGGTPREIAEDVTAADWAPDDSGLAIIRNGEKLEYPIGKVLFQSAGVLSHPRFSPDGKSIAFIDHPPATTVGSLVLCDKQGVTKVLASGFASIGGVAWAPGGEEIWFSAVRGGTAQELLAISRAGKERLIAREVGSITIHDIAHDGRVLFTQDDWRVGIKTLPPNGDQEHDLSWFDWSLMGAISSDGEMVAFSESAAAVDGKAYTYVRGIRGTPAVRLGEGRPWSISRDRKWVAATTENDAQLILLPVGPGEMKRFPTVKGEIFSPMFLGDGKRLLFIASVSGSDRVYLMALDTGDIKPALPEGVLGLRVSPDGKYVVASSASDPTEKIYDLTGGPPRPIKGLGPGERVIGWGKEPLPLYVAARESSVLVKLFRLSPITGQRRFWRSLVPSDPAGVRMLADIKIATDADAYGYSYYRLLSQLYIANGLR